ncbi:MAG TPA: Re/Si-specific NAD(P)(+) transhydrogenase subunit alpha [Dehalococcoidia bacterium]|nr:Re/Si-specific NAD(P)(+) transhydrogenase subunit alpha [Dehalococcoidia bacterium]
MKVGIPKEIADHERRVALSPEVVRKLTSANIEVLIESGAGDTAFLPDRLYEEAGCRLVSDTAALYKESDAILKVQHPIFNDTLGKDELDMMNDGSVLIAFLQPLVNHALLRKLAQKKITSFSMDAVPRIARAQSMDALSSMSSIAGYKAVLIGSNKLGKYLPMMMTAAATIPPAKILVLGVGVAGLQAIATAHRLGAIVEAFDIRPAVKEQVVSLGATFIELEDISEDTEDAGGYAKEVSEETQQRERDLVHQHTAGADIVITAALVPGRTAPILVTEDMVRSMKPGSVVVDLAAEAGGNCEITEPGEEVVKHGVTVIGPLNLASEMPFQASQLYARNISGLLLHMFKDGELHFDFEDVIVNDCCITHQGEVRGQYRDMVE